MLEYGSQNSKARRVDVVQFFSGFWILWKVVVNYFNINNFGWFLST
jgi:hypothetical protein